MNDSAARADAPSPAETTTRGRPPGRPGVRCPHCGSPSRIRTSRTVTPLFTEYRFECLACDHIFVASLTIDRSILPSSRPNPRITLPQG